MCAITDVLSQNGGIPPGECFPLKGSHLHTKKMPRGQYATASTVEGGKGGEGGERWVEGSWKGYFCTGPVHSCAVGWSDLALFFDVCNVHITVDQLYFLEFSFKKSAI